MTSDVANKRSAWRSLREFGAATGVVLGLLFVGVEIRANTAAIQGETLQGISDQGMNLQMQFATDPDLVRLMPQVIGDSILPSDLRVRGSRGPSRGVSTGLRLVVRVRLFGYFGGGWRGGEYLRAGRQQNSKWLDGFFAGSEHGP